MLNVAMIGGGYIGDCHIDAYNMMEDPIVKLAAVIDANEEAGRRCAGKACCNFYKTLEEACEHEDIQMVDICVPTFLHEMFVCKAAEMGLHVLCEKPVTFTLDQFDHMAQTCREHNVKFMVAQVERWVAENNVVKDLVLSGKLGKIHMYHEKRLAQHPAWTTWHRDPARSGGGLYDMNIHDIDFLYSVFGMPKSIYCIGWKSDTGCWNHVVTNMRWDDTQALVETSMEMTGPFPFTMGMQVTGDKGTVNYEMKAGDNIKDAELTSFVKLYPVDGEMQDLTPATGKEFRDEIIAFADAVINDKEVPIPPAQSRQVLELVLASKESLETNKVIFF